MRSSREAPKFVFDRESQSEFTVTLSRAELLNANWRNELFSSRRNKPQVKWFPFLFRGSVWSKPHIASMETETQNRLQKKADIAFLSTSDIFFNLKSAKAFTPVSVTTRPPGHACMCIWGAEPAHARNRREGGRAQTSEERQSLRTWHKLIRTKQAQNGRWVNLHATVSLGVRSLHASAS